MRRGVLLVLLAAAVWALRAPLRRAYDRLTLPAVETVRATRSNPLAASAVSGTAANGYIVAARRAALSADTPGRVVEMNVREGSVVRKGDVVARLYAKEYEAALRRAEAELAAADAAVKRAEAEADAARIQRGAQQANVAAAEARVADVESLVALAQTELDREVALAQSGAGTQQALDEARTKLQRAVAQRTAENALLTFQRSKASELEAQVMVAEASVRETAAQVAIRRAQRDQAQATLEKTEVRAPFDGIVVLKDAEVGEVVSPNSQGGNSRGAVVTMVDFRSLEVQVDLPEKSLAAVAVGIPAFIYLDAYPEIRYRGEVTRIWPTADRQRGSVELRIAFAQPDERLRPEMGVRVVFQPEGVAETEEAEAAAAVIVVPDECVVRIEGRPGVFALERDVVRWRAVALGERRGNRVVVQSGLEGGERLVTRPPADLRDGARVRILQ